MKLSKISKDLELKLETGVLAADPDISSVYSCDLLSRVMSRGSKDGIWITVLSHINIVAVAQLANLACIIVPEGIPVQEETKIKAEEEGINIFSSDMTGYEISWRIHELCGI